MDFMTYSEQLGFGFNDYYKQEAFLNRMYNEINDSSIKFSHALEQIYASEIGLRFVPTYTNDYEHRPIEVLSNAWKYIDSFKDFKLKLASIVVLVNLFKVIERDNEYKILYEGLTDSLELSHILFQVETDDDGVFIFPKGNPILDEGEVSYPLRLLEKYPKSKKCFIDALKKYNDSDGLNASDVADHFRKALEAFFQEFFDSQKSLENFKSDYGDYLKDKGIPSELSKSLVVLLNSYTDFNNNYAKHHEKTSRHILEYILYETGNIIRLLLTLKDVAFSASKEK